MKKILILILCLFINPVFSQTTSQELYNKGVTDFKKGFFSRGRRKRTAKKYLIAAKETFNNIILQYPNSIEAQKSLFKIGFCDYKCKEYASVITKLTEYLTKYQIDTLFLKDEALHQRGLSYLLSKDYQNAETDFLAVIQLKNQTDSNLKNMIPESYYQLWQLYRAQNSPTEAAAIFQAFQIDYPEHSKTKYIANILKNESK